MTVDADTIQYAIWAGLALLCVIAVAVNRLWVKFSADLRAGLEAARQSFKRSHTEVPDVKYPDNVVPFLSPDRQQFLKSREKWLAINQPTSRRERR